MTSWTDIQRLAADLQRVQFADSTKKLSESNSIEVVGTLIKRGLIDVIFTRDGRSYVTKKHLETEVKNEVEALGGRAPLVDIAAALNIDFDHVDRATRCIVNNEEGFVISNGELFTEDYVVKLRRDLEKLLAQQGSRTVTFLCKHWDLSQDLLKALVLDKISETDTWTLDGDTIYTDAYLQRHNNILSAILLPLTKPIQISEVIKQIGLPQKRFWTSFDELVRKGEIIGRLVNSRTSPSCLFVPKRYDEAVKKYAVANFKGKEYLELPTLRKLGVNDNKQSIQQLLDIKDIEVLPSIVVSKGILEQFTLTINEVLAASNGACDVQKALQGIEIPLEMDDIDEICRNIVKTDKNLNTSSGFVFSSSLLTKALTELGDIIESKAVIEVDRLEKEKKQKNNAPAKKTAEDDDSWNDNKKGKKKGGKQIGGKGKGKAEEEKTSSHSSVGVDSDVLEQWLRESGAIPEELADIVAEKIHSEVNNKLHIRVADLMATIVTGDAQSEKKKLATIHAKAKALYDSICSLEASTSKFSESLSTDLSTHIIKTLGTELAANVLSFSSGVDDVDKMTDKQKEELISNLSAGPKDVVAELFESVKACSFEKLHDAVEKVSMRTGCAMELRPPGDKVIAGWTDNYKTELKTAVQNSTEPAAVLLSTVLFLFAKNDKPTAASGKFVQRLIAELAETVPQSLHELLINCQQGVVNCIKNKNDDVAKEMLNQDIQKLIKEIMSD